MGNVGHDRVVCVVRFWEINSPEGPSAWYRGFEIRIADKYVNVYVVLQSETAQLCVTKGARTDKKTECGEGKVGNCGPHHHPTPTVKPTDFVEIHFPLVPTEQRLMVVYCT